MPAERLMLSESRSIGFKERERSRSNGRGHSKECWFRKDQKDVKEDITSFSNYYTTFTCKKFNLPENNFVKNPEVLNIFHIETDKKALVDSGCPKTVAGKLRFFVYNDTTRQHSSIHYSMVQYSLLQYNTIK